MWDSISPALYKQIIADDLLTLPGSKYVRRLSTAIKIDLDLSDATIAYLKARYAKLNPRDLHVNLIFDEVFGEVKVQYSNGGFFGNENGDLTKRRVKTIILSSTA